MKKLVLLSALMIVGSLCFAQPPQRGGKGPSPEEMIKKVTEELSLTDEQVAQWKAIHEKYEESMKDESKREETMKTMNEEFEAILTEEQLEKFTEMREKRGKGRPKDN